MSTYNDDIFNQSDDDIFNEDSSSSTAEKLTAHIKNSHGIDIDVDISSDDSLNNNVRAKIYIALLEASGTWVGSGNTVAFTRSTHTIMDELTNGRYSKLHYYYLIESKIIQRKIIRQLIVMLKETDSADYAFLKNNFKINLDSVFINVYMNTLINILNFTIDRHTSIYLAMSKDLGVVPIETIADHESHDDIIQIQKQHLIHGINSYVTEEYLQNAIEKFSE
jgi:hypothetical protein